ncbi:hypothetical protein DINM_004653 [Dirofilaria immitis]|nr:hypothetical protein [Dirofilaria immitis]
MNKRQNVNQSKVATTANSDAIILTYRKAGSGRRDSNSIPQKADGSGMTVATLGYTMVICGNSDDPQHRYRGRIEKVKFGVPIEEAFVHDIPATLLDIWRAPGNQAQVRKLSHIMQHGRLVNIANFSVYTAASVIKKFLSKLPGGIFGLENEQKLFDLYNTSADLESQRQSFCRIKQLINSVTALTYITFWHFYMISESADAFGSRMTTEALGISVAPSLFHSCIHDGQRAKIEDVIRFKIASEIITRIIENFGYVSLFPRENYEYYARITGRTLRFDENESRLRFITPSNVLDWPVPPPSTYSIMAARCAGSYSMASVAAIDHINSNCGRHSDHNQQQYLQNMFKNVSIWAANRADCMRNREKQENMENNEFEPSLLTSITNLQPQQRTSGYPYTAISDYRRTFFGTGPQHITIATIADDELISKNAKSVFQPDVILVTADSTDDKGVVERNYRFYPRRQTQPTSHPELLYKRLSSSAAEVQIPHSDDDEKYSLNAFHGSGFLESTHSLTYLEWVHERQTRRMRTRSEWLVPFTCAISKDCGTSQLNTSGLSSTSILQPHSQFGDSTISSFDGRTGSPDNTDECLINVTQKLFLSKACEESPASVSGQIPPVPQPKTSPTSRIAGGIVRRRSWRTHYVRPNRIVEGGSKERDAGKVATVSSRSAPLYRRNVPSAFNRSTTGRSIMLPSSLMELQQQRHRTRTSSPEYEKRYYHSTDSCSSTSYGRESKTNLQSRNVHF